MPEEKKVHVKVSIVLETSFTSFGDERLDSLAKEQIKTWCSEVLNDEEFIPLFVTNSQTESDAISITISVQ